MRAGPAVDLRRCTRTVSPLRVLNSRLERPLTCEDARGLSAHFSLRTRSWNKRSPTKWNTNKQPHRNSEIERYTSQNQLCVNEQLRAVCTTRNNPHKNTKVYPFQSRNSENSTSRTSGESICKAVKTITNSPTPKNETAKKKIR